MTDQVVFKDITDGCPAGDGVFDQLMKSIKSHLMEEYTANRIRGSEYTQVYLQSLQTAMQQSIQWQLGAQIAENQAKLIEKQVEQAEKQLLLLEEQRQLLIVQTDQARQQTVNLALDADNIPKQGDLLEAQTEQVGKQTELIVLQAQAQQYNVEETLPAQKAILDQKLITEEAQTKTTTSQGPVEGQLGAQRGLYLKQTEGFDRDAEQKASRIVSDIWGISVSADVADTLIPDNVVKTQMDEMLSDLKNKAGLD